MNNKAAIEALERRLADMERKGNALVEVINDLRKEDGLPPRPPFGRGGGGSTDTPGATVTLSQIRPDTFYGKKLQTAVREYLEMRKAEEAGPAKPRVIYEAITSGGYEFEAKTPDVALVGLRALLRKRSNVFEKLPNGTYGLTSWYPGAKRAKSTSPPSASEDDDEAEDDNNQTETANDDRASSAA